ncbi:hypothetical protein NUSPORA_01031 [Nucleospora cyclopteri]
MILSFASFISTFSIRYVDFNGFDIPDVTEYRKFFIILNNVTEVLQFEMLNHFYELETRSDKLNFFVEDPCKYIIKSISRYEINPGKFKKFNKDRLESKNKEDVIKTVENNVYGPKIDQNVLKMSSNNISKYISTSKNQLGNYDVCNRRLEYIINETKYVYELNGSRYRYTTFPSKYITEEDNTKSTDENLISDNFNNFTFKLFLVNDIDRYKLHKKEILKINESILKKVNNILKLNKVNMQIELVGQLNLIDNKYEETMFQTEFIYDDFYSFQSLKNPIIKSSKKKKSKDLIELNDKSKLLIDFRNAFEPIRIDPDNKRTEMANSHLIMLIKEQSYLKLNHQGMTFFKGANQLNSCYSVVFANENEEFTAKKILHEILHSIGVPHDENSDGYLMNKIYKPGNSANETDKSILLSEESKKSINDFLMNKVLINKFDINKVIESSNDAQNLLKQLRKNTFKEIVETRLGGKAPDTTNTKYYLVLSLIFYIVCIIVAVIYIK